MWKKQTIILHWISALLIVGAIVTVKATHDLKLPDKIWALRAHAILGSTITLLIFIRLYFKFKFRKTNPKSNILANIFHMGIYAILLVMGVSGIGIGIKGGFFEYLFTSDGKPMRSIFGWAHHNVADVLIIAIILHLLAVFFHLFKKGDHSFARMMGKDIKDES